ncbi:uncharacterized protein LY79DRAFT_333972 [Colletotrichum navitas]|uniref:Uncharacterized protein n=1 Tax=Colletotrichum navitas TaxID=681940 RepID=A0AAD8PS58_9PEZI|nr:uncharacterized protein LY79DRAFT_333972 [Colletotrichum navitas]KAK1579739.1 hypothetical protein LY79DRAFT_333972 [Colletotrichum navitas]
MTSSIGRHTCTWHPGPSVQDGIIHSPLALPSSPELKKESFARSSPTSPSTPKWLSTKARHWFQSVREHGFIHSRVIAEHCSARHLKRSSQD